MSGPEHDLQQQLQRLETLIEELERGPESPMRAAARAIVQAVLDLHASGLARMMELIAGADAAGVTLRTAFARDPMIAALLLLHGVHPDDLDTRVRGAVDALAPMLDAQGARVARLVVEGGVIRVGLDREPGRGRLSAAVLGAHVEGAILAAAPDAARVEIDVPDTVVPAAFLPVGEVRMRRGREVQS